MALVIKNLPANAGDAGMATSSSILAWRIPWTEDPGRLLLVYRVTKSRT